MSIRSCLLIVLFKWSLPFLIFCLFYHLENSVYSITLFQESKLGVIMDSTSFVFWLLGITEIYTVHLSIFSFRVLPVFALCFSSFIISTQMFRITISSWYIHWPFYSYAVTIFMSDNILCFKSAFSDINTAILAFFQIEFTWYISFSIFLLSIFLCP